MVLHTFPRPVLHLLQLLIMSPPMQRSGIKTVAATPAKQKDLERNCIPLRLHPGLARFVAALAKLRFRAFPSKCYTKYLVESQTCSHVATKTLSIADGTCGTFVNNIFSTIFFGVSKLWKPKVGHSQLSNHGQERSQAAALALAFALALLVGFLFCCRAMAFPAANGLSKAF